MKYSLTIFAEFLVFILILGVSVLPAQQNLSFVRVSPQAKAVQNIGFATIEIDYSRPGANGREIWGKLVPYGLAPNAFGNGKPMPWRSGANENTTIFLSHDAKVNGELLPAGKYSIHMIVQEDEWTIIFNNDFDAWGSFFYEQENDALRIIAKPTKTHFEEWMTFGFEKLTTASCDAFIHWGEIKVPFTIEFNQHKIVLDKYRDELTGLAGFNQAAWGAAARYCLNNDVNLDEAATWVDKALSMNNGNNLPNIVVKAGLLEKAGKGAEGDKLIEESIGNATEDEINNYGYQLMGQNKTDEAIKMFELNVKQNPDSWNVYDSLGDALVNKGDKKAGKEYYEKAYDMAPAGQKSRIETIIKEL